MPVYDDKKQEAKYIPVGEGTVLIDNSLLNEEQKRRGRLSLVKHDYLEKGLIGIIPQRLSYPIRANLVRLVGWRKQVMPAGRS